MKILKININNIQSLKGIQPEINFTDGILAHAGLYAITGQTGAGKSTILDAITLALYGKINRYGNDKPSAEIITRNQKEAYAEVTFEVNESVYLARWAASFTRNGSINQTDDRKLYRIEDGELRLIAEKVSNVNPKIEEIIGLKYEQFTKSILLAQNNFAAFLKAKPDDRAEMLSKITGTQIYEIISKKIFEQTKTYENEINSLRASINGTVLNDIELANIQACVKENENKIAEIDPALLKILGEISWLAAVESTRNDILSYQTQWNHVAEHFENNTSIYKRLDHYNKARLIEADLQTFQNAAVNCNSNTEETASIQEQIKTLSGAITDVTLKLVAANSSLKETLEEQSLKKPLIEAAKSNLNAIATSLQLVEKNKNELQKVVFNDSENNAVLIIEKQKKLRIENQISENQKVINHYRKYTAWAAEKGAVNLQYSEIKKLQQEIDLLDIESLQRQIATFNPENLSIDNLIAKLKNECEGLKMHLEKLDDEKKLFPTQEDLSIEKQKTKALIENWEKLAETTAKADHENILLIRNKADLEKIDLAKIDLEIKIKEKTDSVNTLKENKTLKLLVASFKDHRHNLKEGEACALCGSTEHPYAVTLPTALLENNDETKIKVATEQREVLIAQKEKAISTISALEQQVLNNKKNCAEFEMVLTSLLTALEISGKITSQRIDSAIESAKAKFELQEKQIQKVLELNSQYESQSKIYAAKANTLSTVELVAKDYQHAAKQINQKKSNINGLFNFIKETFEAYGEVLVDTQLELVVAIGKQLSDNLAVSNTELDNLKANQDSLAIVNTALTEFETKKAGYVENIRKLEQEISELNQQKINFERLLQEQTATFEIKSPIAEESRLHEKVATAQELTGQLNENKTTSSTSLNAKQERLKKLFADKIELDKNQKRSEEQLNKKLLENNFENIASLQEALNLENSSSLLEQKQTFEDKKQQIKGALNASLAKQEELNSKPLTNKNAEDLKIEKEALEKAKTELNQDIGQLNEQISNNNRIQQENKQIVTSLKTKDSAFQKWNQLNKMVGSADGKSFKKFAQDFTLSLLVQHANKHLETMFNRYELFKDDASEEMELQIKDNNFFGEIRNINSLSGGETFLVSLSLALGLSDLASKNTQIRSLFIDEGFGSLDPENLNNALDALELLRQNDDRQIGIISHVEELKKRITTQIQVKKYSSEFSTIEIVE